MQLYGYVGVQIGRYSEEIYSYKACGIVVHSI